MVHATHTLRIASHGTHTRPAMRRKSDAPASADFPVPATDFRAELNKLPNLSASVSPSALLPISTVTPNSSAPVTTSTPTPSTMAPTAQSLFGANPWCTSPGGTGPGVSYSYNPYYFATPETAAKVAQMLGGKVVAMNDITPFGPFQQNQPNQMIQLPNGRLINAGLVAEFYDHGFTQQMVDALIATEVSGVGMHS